MTLTSFFFQKKIIAAEERLDPITGNTISSTITKDNLAVENRKPNQITGKQNSNSMEGSPKECKQNNTWGYVVLGLICGAGAASALFIGPIVILYYKVCMSSLLHTFSFNDLLPFYFSE